jgi:sugar lactone lactonase YvrE
MIPRFTGSVYFEPATEALRYLPEGPRLLQNHPHGGNKLGWVAIQHSVDRKEGSMNVLDLAAGSNTTFPLPGRPGFFAETEVPGEVLIGLERQLTYFNLLTGEIGETVARIDAPESVIINDGLAVECGVLFGTKHLEFNQPVAALYFYDWSTHGVHMVLDRQICSNGKRMRRDSQGVDLIDIDTIPKQISRYRFDAGLTKVLEHSLIKPPESLPAYPDGMRPSPGAEESVVVAYYDGSDPAEGLAQQIRVADGEVLCEWIIPGSPRVTCPEFVRIDGKVKLLFTTAVEGMPEATRQRAPGAGCLYIADTPFGGDLPAAPPLIPH